MEPLSPFRKGGLSFQNFSRMGGSDFSRKKRWVCKIKGLFLKKEVSLIFMLTNPFQCYLSPGFWCVWVCHVSFLDA